MLDSKEILPTNDEFDDILGAGTPAETPVDEKEKELDKKETAKEKAAAKKAAEENAKLKAELEAMRVEKEALKVALEEAETKVEEAEMKVEEAVKAPVETSKVAMEDMQRYYEERVRNHDRIMFIPYTKSYEPVRGFAASVVFSGVTYSFRSGFSTPILEEHHDMVFDWLNETHTVVGKQISTNSEVLAFEEAQEMAARNQG